MAEKNYDVFFKTIADFSSASRAAKSLKKDIDDIRQAEEKLNAVTVTTEAAANTARDRSITKIRQMAREQQAATRASAEHAAAAAGDAVAMEAEAIAAGKVGNAHGSLTSKAKSSSAALRQETNDLDNAGRAADRVVGRFNTLVKAIADLRRASSNSGGNDNDNFFAKLSSEADGFANKVTSIAGVIGTVLVRPIFLLIALLQPLITSLVSVGGAALSVGSSLASIGVGAVAAIPGLAALLSAVGALGAAFSGIGGAFKAYSAQQKASSSAGGGGSNVLSQTNSLINAQHSLLIANRNLLDSEKALNDARQKAVRDLQDLQDAVRKGPAAEAQAAADLQKAKENLANVFATPTSTLGDQQEATVQVTEAQQNLADVQKQNVRNQEDLTAAQKKGIEGSDQVVQAQQKVADAQFSVGQATRELAIQQQGAASSGGAAATAANAYQAALDKLSPSARAVVVALIAAKAQFKAVQQSAQEGFFSQVVKDVPRIISLLPSLSLLLGSSARALGSVADAGIKMASSGPFKQDFGLYAAQNASLIRTIGQGLLYVLDALRSLGIAAGPFTQELADGFKNAAKEFDGFIQKGRESGSIADYLEKIRGRASVVWDIFKNIAITLFNLGKASSDFGDTLLKKLDDITAGWRKVSAAQDEPNSKLKQYLTETGPLLQALGKLFGDLARAVLGVGADHRNIDATTELLQRLDEKVLPALVQFFNSLGQSGFFDHFADFVASMLKLVSALSGAGLGALSALASVMGDFADAINFLVHLPFFGPALVTILTGVATALALVAAASAIGKYTGLIKLAEYIGNLVKSYQAVKLAASEAALAMEAEAVVAETTAAKDMAAADIEAAAAAERAASAPLAGAGPRTFVVSAAGEAEQVAASAAPAAGAAARTFAVSSAGTAEQIAAGGAAGAAAKAAPAVAKLGVLGTVGALAAPVAVAAGVGYAGYKAGNYINDNVVNGGAHALQGEQKELGQSTGIPIGYIKSLKEGGAALQDFYNTSKQGRGFRDSIKQDGDAVGDLTKQFASSQLQQAGFADRAAKSGISLDDLTDAVTGSDTQFNALVDTWEKSGNPSKQTITALKLMRDTFESQLTPAEKNYNNVVNDTAKQLGITVPQLQSYADAMGISKDAIASGSISQKNLNIQLGLAQNIMDGTSTRAKTLLGAIQKYNESSKTAADRTDLLKTEFGLLADKVTALGGATSDASDLSAQLTIAIGDLGSSFDDTYKSSQAIKDGFIDLSNTSGAQLYEALKQVTDQSEALAEQQLGDGADAGKVAATYNLNIKRSLDALLRSGKITKAQYDTLLKSYQLTPDQVQTLIKTPGLSSSNQGVIDLLRRLGILTASDWEIGVQLNAADAKADLAKLVDAQGRVLNPTPKNLLQAQWDLATIKSSADGNIFDFQKFVNGGISKLERYANGNLRDAHVASILAPGTNRLMAEPETHGEAYIPLSTTKRARSLDILSAVMQRFGASGQVGNRALGAGTQGLNHLSGAKGLAANHAWGMSGSSVSNAAKGVSVRTNDNSVTVSQLVIQNPKPEPASDSLPKTIRKMAYLSQGPR